MYFHRVIMPLSVVITNLIRFGIQFLQFLLVFFYYYFFQDAGIQPNLSILLLP